MTSQTSDGAATAPAAAPLLAIGLVVVAMFCISINDMTIKRLSGDYPLHQMVFLRSLIAIPFTLVMVQLEGGWSILRPKRPWLHVLRAILIVMANIVFFAAVAVMPLGTATALFFVAPLIVTLLAGPMLGEWVGPRRLAAVLVGFLGVLIIVLSGDEDLLSPGTPPWVVALPMIAAAGYAGMLLLTRKLGAGNRASAMAIYIQSMFLATGALFFLVAGDGRFSVSQENPAFVFLLRAWIWPSAADWPWLIAMGVMGAVIAYSLSQAYRLGEATTLASYEYIALPMAIFWGWVIFGDVPDLRTALGIALIAGAGLFIFLREKQKATVRETA